jgi:hypothetical protein
MIFNAIFFIFTRGVFSFIIVDNATRSIESSLAPYNNTPGECFVALTYNISLYDIFTFLLGSLSQI